VIGTATRGTLTSLGALYICSVGQRMTFSISQLEIVHLATLRLECQTFEVRLVAHLLQRSFPGFSLDSLSEDFRIHVVAPKHEPEPPITAAIQPFGSHHIIKTRARY